jgi:ankyrin repeat protein
LLLLESGLFGDLQLLTLLFKHNLLDEAEFRVEEVMIEAMYNACQHGHFSIIKFMFEKGVLKEHATSENITNMAERAATMGYSDIVSFLVKKRLSYTTINESEYVEIDLYSIISEASIFGHLNIIKAVNDEPEMDMQLKCKVMAQAALEATCVGDISIVRYIFEIANIDMTLLNVDTLLWNAMQAGAVDVIEYLLKL